MTTEEQNEEEEKQPEGDDLNKQLQELLKHAKVQFVGPQGFQQPDGSPPHEEEKEDEKAKEALRRIRQFNLKPKEVRDYLDRFVIKQTEAKKVLAVAMCDHYNHVRRCIEKPELRDKNFAKHNIILMGPTGVGKTYLMRCLAKLIGVPFVKADATKFSETGYVGYDVEDIVRDLVKMADGNTELAQYGIIFIDEIDKIAGQLTSGTKDVSGRGVQVNLLKLMEETDVNLFSQTDILGQMQAMMEMQRGKAPQRMINTRHMLFIVSGAFDKLADVVKQRIESTKIGFRHEMTDVPKEDFEYLKDAQAEDFTKYGFEPEFVGRLPIRVACDTLSAEDLEQILLMSEDSVLEQYREDFRGYDIAFSLTSEAIREISVQAYQEKTGARGLMTVLERVLRNFKFELPSTSVESFEVKSETIADPQEDLTRLLQEHSHMQDDVLRAEVEAFANRFEDENHLRLQFEDDAIDALVEISLERDKTVRAICEDKFKDFQFGLKLISAKTGRKSFTITRQTIEDPDKDLSSWVVQSYPEPETRAST